MYYVINDKNHMIISIYIWKECDKIQHTFIIQQLNKPYMEGNFLNLTKGIYEKTHS